MKNWYYKVGDKEFGPITEEELLDGINHGKLTEETLIQDEEMDISLHLNDVLNLFNLSFLKTILNRRNSFIRVTYKGKILVTIIIEIKNRQITKAKVYTPKNLPAHTPISLVGPYSLVTIRSTVLFH